MDPILNPAHSARKPRPTPMHISSDFRYFCILIAAFMCMLPMDPVVPPVLNNGSGNAYFAKVATPGAASTQLTIAGTHCRGFDFRECKSEDAAARRGHGLEREWARPVARFGTEMFIFTRFLRGICLTHWVKQNRWFYKQFW